MTTVCYVNLYQSYSDRGAFVQQGAWQSTRIEEQNIRVGEPLPGWPSSEAPIVKSFDPGINTPIQYVPGSIKLSYKGVLFVLKAGDEAKLDSSLFSQEQGVSCYILECVRLENAYPVYTGDWQVGETILQKLEGPKGKGKVQYPNGDMFEGEFNLSFRSIQNEAYTAFGKYTFVDGSYIENAWIKTDSTGKRFELNGVFRVKHPYGSDSIVMYINHKKCGFEFYLNERYPFFHEWYNGEQIEREPRIWLEGYKLDESKGADMLRLVLKFKGGGKIHTVCMQGGDIYENEYGSAIYKPCAVMSVKYPNGDVREDRCGTALKLFQPQDFYLTYHCASKHKYRLEEWEKGELVKAYDWKPEDQTPDFDC